MLINPEILAAEGRAPGEEGCLSLPGIYEKLERAERIRVRALDRNGERFELDADGMLAVCIQHEMDHLEGKLFVDYLSELKRQLIRRRLQKERKQRSEEAPAGSRSLGHPWHKRSLRLGFAGTPAFAVAALEALARSEHLLAAVFTRPDRPAGRGRRVRSSPVKQRALELGIPVLQPATSGRPMRSNRFAASHLDALVVVAYGLILPAAALAAPRLGCFNIHASLLPRWRGAAPIQRALLAGDPVTGVTIMRMEAGLDTGPMLAARAIEIAPLDTGGTLHDRLAVLGAELVRETLDALAQGPVPETPAAGGRRHLRGEDLEGRGGDRLARGCRAGAAQGPSFQSGTGRADAAGTEAASHLGSAARARPAREGSTCRAR